MGVLRLRRRRRPSSDVDICEIKPGDEILMSPLLRLDRGYNRVDDLVPDCEYVRDAAISSFFFAATQRLPHPPPRRFDDLDLCRRAATVLRDDGHDNRRDHDGSNCGVRLSGPTIICTHGVGFLSAKKVVKSLLNRMIAISAKGYHIPCAFSSHCVRFVVRLSVRLQVSRGYDEQLQTISTGRRKGSANWFTKSIEAISRTRFNHASPIRHGVSPCRHKRRADCQRVREDRGRFPITDDATLG